MSGEVHVVEHILQILQEGAYTSTYKLAVLLGLMDLCVENTAAGGAPPHMLTTRQLAEKVVELYWGQVKPWGAGVTLKQNKGSRGVIVREVDDLRRIASAKVSPGAGLRRARVFIPAAVERVVRVVERKLIEMPLPKLQRVGGDDTNWLYTIHWDDANKMPKQGTITAYQRGKTTDFDNRILFKPHVASAFVRLGGLLRPFVEDKWVREVASINGMDESKLFDHLFGVRRTDLDPVRDPLHELQSGTCFYCGGRLHKTGSQIDHFIPWARHSDNGLDNLVLAHAGCNNDKRDFLAASVHVARWRTRREGEQGALRKIAEEVHWDLGGDRTLGAARALYLGLPDDARLWAGIKQFVVADPARLADSLA